MSPKGVVVLAVLIIAVGAGWLMSSLGLFPQINWVWTFGLAAAGVLTFALSRGIDKFSVIVGPFFLVSSLLSIFRQQGRIPLDVEVPILVITFGILLLIAQSRVILMPSWTIETQAEKKPRL